MSGTARPTVETQVIATDKVKWGTEATDDECVLLAMLIIRAVTEPQPLPAQHIIDAYAREVVRAMRDSRTWLINTGAVESWLLSKTLPS